MSNSLPRGPSTVMKKKRECHALRGLERWACLYLLLLRWNWGVGWSALSSQRKLDYIPKRLGKGKPSLFSRFHERNCCGQVGIGVHFQHIDAVILCQPQIDTRVIPAIRQRIGFKSLLHNPFFHFFRELGGTDGVNTM